MVERTLAQTTCKAEYGNWVTHRSILLKKANNVARVASHGSGLSSICLDTNALRSYLASVRQVKLTTTLPLFHSILYTCPQCWEPQNFEIQTIDTSQEA